jgi:hypothetical protein
MTFVEFTFLGLSSARHESQNERAAAEKNIMNKKKTTKSLIPNNSFTEFLLYTTPNGKVKVEIFLRNENIWLTQAKIGELFAVDRSVVTKHLQNIYETKELNKEATCAKIAQVQNEENRSVATLKNAKE